MNIKKAALAYAWAGAQGWYEYWHAHVSAHAYVY